jgi:hypothetical protein
MKSKLTINWKYFGRRGLVVNVMPVRNCIKGLREAMTSQSKDSDLALPKYKDKHVLRQPFSSAPRLKVSEVIW